MVSYKKSVSVTCLLLFQKYHFSEEVVKDIILNYGVNTQQKK